MGLTAREALLYLWGSVRGEPPVTFMDIDIPGPDDLDDDDLEVPPPDVGDAKSIAMDNARLNDASS